MLLTNMKTYKLNNVEISEKDLRQLIQDNPELLKKSNSVPFQDGDNYYIVDIAGDASNSFWWNDAIDYYRLDTGNAFKTQEEAKKKAEQMKALARVNKYIRENDLRLTDVDWNDDEQSKWNIYHDVTDKVMRTGCWTYRNYKSLIAELKSEEAGKQVIENCIDDLEVIFDVK